jgi:hypothetical protein
MDTVPNGYSTWRDLYLLTERKESQAQHWKERNDDPYDPETMHQPVRRGDYIESAGFGYITVAVVRGFRPPWVETR